MTFNFCGKISPVKESGSMKPIDIKTFEPSYWTWKTFSFRAKNDDNSHIIKVKAGYWGNADGSVDDSKTEIYTFKKGSGEKAKSEKFTVKYADRFDENIVDSVVPFKKFSIDLTDYNKEEKRNKDKYKEYIFEDDFINALNKIVNTAGVEDYKFKVFGNVDIHYNEEKETFYKDFIATKVSIAKDSEEEKMNLNGDIIFSKYSFDDDEYSETNKVTVNGWTEYYDGKYSKDSCKGKVRCPISFEFSPNNDAAYTAYKARITNMPDGCQYSKMKFSADVINSSPKETPKLTIDDLTEEVREDIEFGLTDLETELKRAEASLRTYGEYGERVVKYELKTVRDAEATVYEDSDMNAPVHDAIDPKASVNKEEKSDDDDIFDI